MTPKDSQQSSQHGMPLLRQRGKLAANTATGCQSSLAANGARDLLLHVDHPQITLRLMVGEGDRQLVQKRQPWRGSTHPRHRAHASPPAVCLAPAVVGAPRVGAGQHTRAPARRTTGPPTPPAPRQALVSLPAPATRAPPHPGLRAPLCGHLPNPGGVPAHRCGRRARGPHRGGGHRGPGPSWPTGPAWTAPAHAARGRPPRGLPARACDARPGGATSVSYSPAPGGALL